MSILLYGGTGWIGGQLAKLLKAKDFEVITAKARLENPVEILVELELVKPERVIIAAGLTGRPNIDWCEDHKKEVMDVNVLGTLFLIEQCKHKKIHVTFFGTGCIYEYDDKHPIGGTGFSEKDVPNFRGSFYSLTKIIVQDLIEGKCLLFRMRMPLSDDLHARNFITKITKYEKVINIANSMTVLYDLLPVAVDMIIKKLEGTFNFVNPGTIDHNTILTLYQKYIDPTFKWTNFSLEEQTKILKAGRSNVCLDCTKLVSLYPEIPPISISIVRLFERMKANLSV